MAKNRFIEMDMLRGMAILAVILIHISSGETGTFYLIINQLSRFAVPIFLFLSGLGLTLSDKLNEGYFIFLKKRISKVLPLYLLWTIIYSLVTLKENISALGLVKSVILGNAFYHLYYVPLIIAFYILYPLLKRMARNKVAMIVILLVTIASQLTGWLFDISILKDTRNLLNWSIYFVLGIWFANNYEAVKQKLKSYPKITMTLLFVTVVGIVSETFLYLNSNHSLADATTSMRPTIILYTVLFISFIMIVKWSNKTVTNVINELSKLSYGIYLSHALFLSGWYEVFPKIGLHKGTVLFAVSSFFIVLLCSGIITKVVDFVMAKVNLGQVKKTTKANA